MYGFVVQLGLSRSQPSGCTFSDIGTFNNSAIVEIFLFFDDVICGFNTNHGISIGDDLVPLQKNCQHRNPQPLCYF